MQPVFELTEGKSTVKIYLDSDPESPRSWSTFGEILYIKNSRYTLGDKALDADSMADADRDADFINLPVFAYIHSGIALNTTGFNCPWDSAQTGIIRVSKDKIKKEFNVNKITPEIMAKSLTLLKSEVEMFSKYLNGEVYGFIVTNNETGEETDSCWGYYEEPKALARMALDGDL